MAYHAGETISDTAYVESAPGVSSALPAATVFSSIILIAPDNSLLTPPVVTDLPQAGLYEVTFTTLLDQPGTYTVEAVGAEMGETFLATYDVDTAVKADITGMAGTPFGELRVVLADDLADHLELIATSNSSGPNVLVDAINLVESQGVLRSSHGVIRSAADPANVGRIVRIMDNSPVNSSVTFAPDLASAIQSGDIMDLFNISGYGFRPQLYDLHLKGAIQQAYSDFLLEISQASAVPFDADDGYVPIPEQFVAVYAVFYMQDGDTEQWRDVRPARQRGIWGSGWSVDRPQRRIRIDGEPWLSCMDGCQYVIGGYARHEIPDSNADIVSIPVDWLLTQAKSSLAKRKISERRWNDWAVEWGRQADGKRMDIWTPRKADTVFLVT